MAHKFRLHIALAEERQPDGTVGLLFPIPPTTADQALSQLTVDPTWETQQYTAQDSTQSALLATFSGRNLHKPMQIEIALCKGPLIEEHFVPRPGRSTDPRADARQLYADLHLDEITDEKERLRRIVDCISDKFEYQHDFRSDAPLTCDLLTGNCLDINAALIKLFRLANIKHAYYIGYFFEAGQSTGGRHCWVSTISGNQYESWDIAHHLKRDVMQVESALNPIPGSRFAMSTGWDPVFNIQSIRVEVPHLATPRWIFEDGRSHDCRVHVTAERVS